MTQSNIINIITKWKLNKNILADKAGINRYTFKMKLLERPNYAFTEDEIKEITKVLKQLIKELDKAIK